MGIGRTATTSAQAEYVDIDKGGRSRVERVSTIPTVSPSIDFGKPISADVQMTCVDLMVEEWGCPPLLGEQAVTEAAGLLEKDLPDAAIRTLMVVCDLTGAYRLLAMMATL